MQLLHEADAIETLRLASVSSRPGVVNVAGAGAVALSQLLRRIGRLRLPVPGAALGLVGAVVGNNGAVDVPAEDAGYLSFGRVVDTSRLRAEFGYTPGFSTAEVVESYLQRASSGARAGAFGLGVGSRLLQARRGRRRPAIS